MRLKRTLLIVLIFLVLFTGFAAADYNYIANVELQRLQGNSNNGLSWTPVTAVAMNKSLPFSYGGLTIRYSDIDTINHDQITFAISSSTYTVTDSMPMLKAGDSVCLVGSCPTTDLGNRSTSYVGNVLMKLVSIGANTNSGGSSNTDTPVLAYVIVDSNKKSLIKGGTLSFDAKSYTQDTGWSSDSVVSEINVYFERESRDLYADVALTATASSLPEREETEDWVKYKVTQAGTYKFTVTYDETSLWGKTVEVKNLYTFVVKSVGGTPAPTKTASPAQPTTLEASVGVPKRVTMASYGEGQFDTQTGATITTAGSNIYSITFDSVGTKILRYTPTDGSSPITLTFNVALPSASATNTPITGNQQQQTEGDYTYLILAGVAAVLILLYFVLFKRKKGGGGGKYQLHTQPQ